MKYVHMFVCISKGLRSNLNNKINYESMNDEKVVELAQRGDSSATDFILNKYKDFVELRSMPYFMAGGERDDLIQEGLIGLYKAIKSYSSDKKANFKTFAEICVVRQMISAVKSSTRKKNSPLNYYISIHVPEDEMDTISGKLIDIKNSDPESMLIEQESAQGMQNKINSVLSDFESEVLGYYLSGASYKAIADVIGKSPKAVDNALCRIKKKIEKYI